MRRTAVVTGGAGGIGGAIVRALADAGHEVAILDRRVREVAASKAALVGIARSLAKPLGAHGITVNCVAPGLTRTPFTEGDLPAEAFEEVLARQALPRTLMPDDTAGVVAFLAGDAAAAVTGQTLCADGGSVFA
jgi:NAD(P)-dependent dehydrogenase (short-subunit alcohol dehydrogenase family)